MKKLIIFIALVYSISCSSMCDGTVPEGGKKCTDYEKADPNNDYCCYYTGNDAATGDSEKICWEFAKTDIDNGKIKDTIKKIEDGTESHSEGRKKNNVKLECSASYLKNYFLLGLLLLF